MKKPIDLYKIGEKIEFNDARERTNGQRSEAKLTIQPGKSGPPAHIHTKQIEGFEVTSGSMVIIINGKESVLKQGEQAIVKAGELHTFKNGSKTEVLEAKFWYEPALNIEWSLQVMGEDAMERGGDWNNVSLLPAMYVMYKLRNEYRLGGMPYWLQDVIFGIAAFFAKITGADKKFPLPDSLKD
jgi:mannose-6-phosphate isomerase-like protein (cupin superfamily)